jgi:hypothetical protein
MAALKLLDCETDEAEKLAKHVALGRGMFEPTSRVVTVTGWAEFVPGPGDQGGRIVILTTDDSRHWIAAKAFSDVMEIGLKAVGYRPDEFFKHHANLDVTVWLTVADTTDMEVEVKSVVLVAAKGDGHSTYSLGPDKDNEALYRELSEELEQEARALAGH